MSDKPRKISRKKLSIMRAAAALTRPNRYRDPIKAKKPAPITLPATPWNKDERKP